MPALDPTIWILLGVLLVALVGLGVGLTLRARRQRELERRREPELTPTAPAAEDEVAEGELVEEGPGGVLVEEPALEAPEASGTRLARLRRRRCISWKRT